MSGATGKATPHWEHFAHQADIGIRGIGPTRESAFEQAGLALTAAICDPAVVTPTDRVDIACGGDDVEMLFMAWLNELVFEMATQRMLFGRFEVDIRGDRLSGRAWGEAIDARRHRPAVEVKGATATELRVAQSPSGQWIAQCVVDV